MQRHFNRSARTAAFLVCAMILVPCFAGGCGSGRVPVSGTVLLDGEPATNGYVSFVPSDGGASAGTGQLDSSGKFTMSDQRGGEGLLPGEYLVAVAAGETPAHRDERGKFHPTTYASPPKYANPQTSGLTAKVEGQSGQTFEFRLER